MKESELELDLSTVTINCTLAEVATTLAALLREIRLVIPRLRPDERVALRTIMSQESGRLTVADVFPGFTRESEGHKTLRRLRAAQFVRPANTGHWIPDEPIEVKPFARLAWERIGEDQLFSGSDRSPLATPARKPIVVDRALADEDREDVLNLLDFAADELRNHE